MSSAAGRSTLDGLPKQFVASMRTLFDIMDDRKRGYVHLADIESRWRDREEHYHQQQLQMSNSGGLPPRGLIESLRKVTPPNGLLSFERFCAGLKICLLRNSRSSSAADAISCSTSAAVPPPASAIVLALHDANGQSHVAGGGAGGSDSTAAASAAHHQRSSSSSSASSAPPPPPAVRRQQEPMSTYTANGNRRSVPSQSVPPIIARHPPSDSHQFLSTTSVITKSSLPANKNDELKESHNKKSMVPAATVATVRPNTLMASSTGPGTGTTPLRTVSMPQLGSAIPSSSCTYSAAAPPPPPPSQSTGLMSVDQRLRSYKSETRMSSIDAVHSMRQQRTLGTSALLNGDVPMDDEHGLVSGVPARSRHGIMTVLHNWHMGMLSEQLEAATLSAAGTHNNIMAVDPQQQQPIYHRRETSSASTDKLQPSWMSSASRRREPRRHTLANGIDYNMLKRMKQLEQEKDVLLQGLEAVDKARAWYLRQIVDVQEKMKYIGHSSGHQEYSMEAHQERLNFEMAHIFEVNQNLSALVESSERGFPLHMNLAVRQPRPPAPPPPPPPPHNVDTTAGVIGGHVAELNRQVSAKSERITQLEMEKAALVRELFQARSSQAMATSVIGGKSPVHPRDTTLM